MNWTKGDKTEFTLAEDSNGNRCQTPRYDGQLKFTFSGMDANGIVMDTGLVTDLCRDGIGACSEHSLTTGMDLALFIECPDSDDHLCVPEARVAWVSGNRFGLSIRTMKAEDLDRLHQVFFSPHQQPQRTS
jgi:hypothetical protein